MSIRAAGELVKQAQKEERAHCIAVILKHIGKQSSGICCDNCNCLGVRRALEALGWKPPRAAISSGQRTET